MIHQTDKQQKTDQAWKQLYARLEQDGLLKDTPHETGRSVRLQVLRWAAVVILCVSGATLFYQLLPKHSDVPMVYLQNKEVTTLVTTLEDGSMVYLAGDAQLEYPEHFEMDKREVSLQGNALFDVSGNRERPFLIETRNVQIEVLGTSFHVKSMANHSFELSVRRGEVKVTLKENNKSVYVKAGETASLAAGSLIVSETLDMEQFNRYMKRIHFKDVRLADILKAVNQQSPDVMLATVSSLEDRKLTVSFDNDSPEVMAELICQALKLKYTKENGILLISER